MLPFDVLNQVFLMDCLEGMALLPSNSCDLAVVDPPYGIAFNTNHRKIKGTLKTEGGILHDEKDNASFLRNVLDRIYRVLKPGTHLYWFTRWDKIPIQYPLLVGAGFSVKNSLIWAKNNWGMGDLSGAYAGQYENILFAHKGRRPLNGKRLPDILTFPRIPPSLLVHSHQKPVELLSLLIEKSSNENDVVLIPFAGSGSECVAAKNLKRNFIGFELDPYYADLANWRVQNES